MAASEDALLDSLSDKAEKEIVSGGSAGKNLIGHCAPFLSKLCRNYALMQKVIAFFCMIVQVFEILCKQSVINGLNLYKHSYCIQKSKVQCLLLYLIL